METKNSLPSSGRFLLVLRRRWASFLAGNLVTVLSLVPFGLGVFFAIGEQNILVLAAVCVLSGLLVGPMVSCLVDLIFRSLRGSADNWAYCYRRALRQNARCSCVPGMILCLITGFTVYMLLLFLSRPGLFWMLGILFVSFLFSCTAFLLYWPQLVLFDMDTSVRLRNLEVFLLRHLWRVLGVSLLNAIWWCAGLLLLPWSLLLLPVLGLWLIWYVSFHLLYDPLNREFDLERQIYEKYPEQSIRQ